MKILSAAVPRNFNLYIVGDTHIGTRLFHHSGFMELVDKVDSDKTARMIHLGDLVEAIAPDDDRYQHETLDETTPDILTQYHRFIHLVRPVRKKMLGILMGNHDFKLHRFGNVVRDVVCRELEVPFGTYTTKMGFKDLKGRLMFKMFLTHGAKSITTTADDPIRQRANMELQLKQRLKNKAADCVLMAMGHCHKLLIAKPTPRLYLVDDGRKIKQHYTGQGEGEYIHPDHRWYCDCGSFLRLYGPDGVSGYAERFGYDPVELGYIVAEIRDGEIADVREIVI